MDARIIPHSLFNLGVDEAHILCNAGGSGFARCLNFSLASSLTNAPAAKMLYAVSSCRNVTSTRTKSGS